MIACEGVELRYSAGARPVLAGCDLAVAAGEFVCLLGPSGSGKTTLLNLLAGFLRPSAGRVLFRGEPVAGPGPARAVVFQDPTLFPWLSVADNVAFGLRCAGRPRGERRRRVSACLERVGLPGSGRARVHQLSGGMRQRVALARALVLDPPVLLMDEPFGALDANTREHLQDELLGIWERERRTVVFVTHDVTEAAYLAERVLVIGADGRLVADEAIDVPRPRRRGSERQRALQDRLRAHLDRLPCCFAPRERDDGAVEPAAAGG